MLPSHRIAVVIGIGEITDRTRNPAQVPEPTALIAQALAAAASDAGPGWLERVDSVDLVALSSWRYKNPVGDVCKRIGIAPPRMVNSRRGGETPVRLLHEAALAVVNGERKVCAVVGGEATSARTRARKTGAVLPWPSMPPLAETTQFPGLSTVRSALAERYDMLEPARIYPLYETAAQAAWKQSPDAAHGNSAQLWERYAAVAESNPYAWIRDAPDAETIGSVSSDNRLINWPYPKLMVANPSVNQAAAFIVTTLAEARAAGISEDRLVYVMCGAAANEPDDFLQRDRYDRSAAQEAVLTTTVDQAGGIGRLAFMELYSCFPIVPKMALRTLGPDAEKLAPTVAGGLTFFGGPLHNYMSHAICAMVRTLRLNAGAQGLLYGQGGYVTKHHAIVLGSQPPTAELIFRFAVQDKADAIRGLSPCLLEEYEGPASIEAYTVQYSKAGEPIQGIVVLRTPDGERTMARVPPEDRALSILQSWGSNAVGTHGLVTIGENNLARWIPNSHVADDTREMEP